MDIVQDSIELINVNNVTTVVVEKNVTEFISTDNDTTVIEVNKGIKGDDGTDGIDGTSNFVGSAIGAGVDLNTLLTPGVYRSSGGSNATLALNYPLANAAGVLEVFYSTNAASVVQRFTPFGGVSNTSRGVYIRRVSGGTPSPWTMMSGQVLVNPAGQPGVEISTYDDVNNLYRQIQLINIALSGVDLNLVTTAGIYRQTSNASATLANNYPVGNIVGILEVFQTNGTTQLIQRLTPTGGGGGSFASARGYWQRRLNSGTWDAWMYFGRIRTDKTAGIAMYVHEDIGNRDQLIYGDTGWYDISSLLINGWTGTVWIRRENYGVSLRMLAVTGGTTTAPFLNSISGFGCSGGTQRLAGPISSVAMGFAAVNNVGTISLTVGTTYGGGGQWTEMSWRTTSVWPTSLPGTLVGTIPNL